VNETTHDVLCVGHASYDLVFSVPRHPAADEKIFADAFLACGGGPAANAAVIVARLGLRSAFAGYLGEDAYGASHASEFALEGVDTRWLARGNRPTPISAVLVKPDGARALVNYKGETLALPAGAIDFSAIRPKVLLFDGHEPLLSAPLGVRARTQAIPTVLDAGSLHSGTQGLMRLVDYLVASEKFAAQWLGTADAPLALARLAEQAPVVVITLGEHGLIWRKHGESGSLPAFPVSAVDSTGAGDAFHGAFAAGLAAGLAWPELLRYASAAGAFCCQRQGARPGLAMQAELRAFIAHHSESMEIGKNLGICRPLGAEVISP
jgi:sulfofructose kinase